MMNYVTFMIALLALDPAITPEYKKPINYKVEPIQKYVKPLDVDQTEAKWVRVEDVWPTYDEIRDEAIYNCKNNQDRKKI